MSESVLTIATPAASTIYTADQLRKRLHINSTAEDDLLSEYQTAALSLWEKHTGRPIRPTVYRESFWNFTDIQLTRGPVTTVASVEYRDSFGTLQTLNNGLYVVDDSGRLVRIRVDSPPSLSGMYGYPVRVNYTAGIPDPVPDEIRVAIAGLVGHWYRNREAYTDVSLDETPAGFQRVVDLFRLGTVEGN